MFRKLFLKKFQTQSDSQPKETSIQNFFCDFCKIFLSPSTILSATTSNYLCSFTLAYFSPRFFSRFLPCTIFDSGPIGVQTVCNFIKKRLQHRCLPVNIANFLRAAFLQNTSNSCCYTQPIIELISFKVIINPFHANSF